MMTDMFSMQSRTIKVGKSSLRYSVIPWDSEYLQNSTTEIDEIQASSFQTLTAVTTKLFRQLHLHKGDLLVCKIPFSAYPFVRMIEQLGFHFMEQSITLNIDLTHWNPKVFIGENEHSYKLEVATTRDKKTIRAIANRTFISDRFHLDPSISSSLSNHRFEMWIENSFAGTDTVYKFINPKRKIIGFFITNESNHPTELRLSGLDPRYTGKGLGKMIYHHVYRMLQGKKLTQIKAVISLNNLPVLNVYTYLGSLKFTDPTFVLHKVIGRD